MAEAFLALYRQTTRITSWSICIAAFFFLLAIVCALLGLRPAEGFAQVAAAFAVVFAALFAVCCAGWLVSAAAGWITGHTKTAPQKS